MAATIIPAQPGYSVRSSDGLQEPVIAWLFDPSETHHLRPLPLTPSGKPLSSYALYDADGDEVYAG